MCTLAAIARSIAPICWHRLHPTGARPGAPAATYGAFGACDDASAPLTYAATAVPVLHNARRRVALRLTAPRPDPHCVHLRRACCVIISLSANRTDLCADSRSRCSPAPSASPLRQVRDLAARAPLRECMLTFMRLYVCVRGNA
ncbi:hypothetical protein X777_15557 [Ooceraea biroi]|uniref:Uncharacterized protein n=1 Tax=Ooceraea biroi TaxID=2015173 RepID=A0A026VUS9_OOCBI|nr:hypothetical protein X777_15557 [Ooceraea biroi]